MKKFLTFLFSVAVAVCLCVPFAACDKTDKQQTERKNIIGIDSDKVYLKSKIYRENGLDLIGKKFCFNICSYDKIEADELQGVEFDVTASSKYNLTAESWELKDFGYYEEEGYYDYYVIIYTYMRWASDDVHINSVTLKISGYDYTFKTDIDCVMTYRFINVKPEHFGFNTLNAGRFEPYGLLINPRYDMTLKSIKFQTDGFEILSYEVESYIGPQEGEAEKITDTLPVKLESGKSYQINVEAIPPQDCLYYGYDLEAVVEIDGHEMVYNNLEYIGGGDIGFKGSALNALTN